jgi:hypothetical protein
MANYQVGERVRVVLVPPYLHEATGDAAAETLRFFESCLGKEFQIRSFDAHGQIELWANDDGDPADSVMEHSIWIEPEYGELVVPQRAPLA